MRLYTSLLATALAFGLLAPAFAQQTAPPPPQADDEDEVVRITTNLVQIDAVVTDRDGRHVTDLRPEDFEISEDGKAREISNFSYVDLESRTSARADVADSPRERSVVAPAPSARAKVGQTRRTVALIVDDLSLSYESAHRVRRALKKYLDEQLQAGDLSAVIRTGSGSGVLQQFTTDRRLLDAAVERLRWHPRSRAGFGGGGPSAASVDDVKSDTYEQNYGENSVRDSIDALTYIVRGFRNLPGRKAVVLFTDSLPLFNRDRFGLTSNVERMRKLIDLANRSSVVFYVIDTRGADPLSPTAEEPGAMPHQTGERLKFRMTAFTEAQDGMEMLARETGGVFYQNGNNFNKGLGRVLEDQRGYYLIGYRPDDSTFDARTGERHFRDLKVRVKRPGLKVRTRAGFYGVADTKENRPRPQTKREQMLEALTNPFGAAGIDLSMAALFVEDPRRGAAVRSVVHLDAQDLEFKEEAGGKRRATLDVAVIVFAGDGHPSVQGTDKREIVLNEREYREALKNGLTYRLNVPVSRPGGYQLSVAVRDASNERTGSAREFVSVPDLRKGPLSLSGVVLAGVEPSREASASAAEQLTGEEGVGAEAVDPGLSPAVRKLRHGVFLDYGYAIYNAKADKATGQPRVTTQVRLFREGRLVFTGAAAPLDLSGQDAKRLVAGGRLQVGTELAPGDYVLQVVVTDEVAKGRKKDGTGTATQWVDFEVVGNRS
ncbi:MAG: VWA domain-containing protein [Acidobacteria bacterium]|nr:VWA domain-containing protein [Acidobacteriota bacterium]